MGARTLQKLNALAVAKANTPGYLGDGGGLYLQVTSAGARSWIYRFMLQGRRREMGLGPYPDVSLASARALASNARSLVKTGQDPIDARRQTVGHRLTFDEAAKKFIEANEVAWRAETHRKHWRVSLATYASPVVGSMAVGSIGLTEIKSILTPIWHDKPETAFRLRGRIERVLDWATVSGHRDNTQNPARWRGHLDKILPALSQVHRAKHFESVPVDGVATIYDRLCQSKAMSALGLRFIILTAARAGEVAGLTWGEIDMEGRVWALPATRSKTGRVHRVPLSDEAIAVLKTAQAIATGDLVFPGWSHGRPLALKSFRRILASAGGGSATVHGFRSSFRDWASERTTYPREVAEMALAHLVGSKVELAYLRTDMFERRKLMMADWSNFVALPHSNTVVPITRRTG